MKIYERERMIKEQGFDEGIEVGLRNFIDVCRELGCDKAEIAEKLKEKFQLTEKETEESMELYWKE